MDSKIIRILLFFFLLPINSYATEFQGSFKQGSFILGKTNQNSEVYIDKKKVRVTKDGYFAFGIDRDRKNNVIIKVINNAGTNIPEHFLKIRKQDMEKVVKINTIAAFNVANLVALKMVQTKNRKKIGAAIVNMSSQMGHVGGPIRSVYNMTKFGIEGLTKGMAIDLAKYNIRVNSIAPTFVVTPMTKKFFKNKNFRKEVLGNIPLGRYAELPEISSAAVFLASDAASMITGTSLLVDGGWTAR